jgi:hypothetical protein
MTTRKRLYFPDAVRAIAIARRPSRGGGAGAA